MRQGLENFVAEIPKIGRRRLYRVAQGVYKQLGVYAPQPYYRVRGRRRKNYKRTYALRNSRQIQSLDNGYQIINDPVDKHGVHYGVFVRGDAAGIGQSYRLQQWKLTATIVDEEVAKLPKEVLDDLSIALAKQTSEANQV